MDLYTVSSDSRKSPRTNMMTNSHERQDTSDDEHCSLVGGKKYLNVVHGEDKISFDSSSRRGSGQSGRGFIPFVSISAKIIKVDPYEDATKFSISPYTYTIELIYGDHHRWSIKRRYKDFLKLHSKITVSHKSQALRGRSVNASSRVSAQNLSPIDESKIHHNPFPNHSTSNFKNKYGSIGNTPASTPTTQEFREGSINGSTSTAFLTAESTCRNSTRASPKLSSRNNRTDRYSEFSRESTSEYEHSDVESDDGQQKKIKFPKKPDNLIPEDDKVAIEKRRRRLEAYLNYLLHYEEYRNHSEMLEFLEVSEFSFIDGLSAKDKEGMVKKRLGDDIQNRKWYNLILGALQKTVCLVCINSFRWNNMWCIIQDTSILGLDPKTGEIHVVLLFDKRFKIHADRAETGVKKCIRFSNLSRQLWIKIPAQERFFEWKESIERTLTSYPGQDFISPNPHDSFAPARKNQRAYWFVDGDSLMSAVADVIEKAKEEIFITDWWLSPEIYLKRGIEYDPKYRLNTLLRKKAKEGVKIFILLYKELELALALNSFYTKKTLMRGGPNIKVLRHPDRASGATTNEMLWAHHEKIVVVDQIYAFVGGIDLCYGRWDNHNHHLTDLDATDFSATIQKPNTTITVNEQETVKEQTPKFPTISPSLLGFGGPNTSSRPTARTQGNPSIMHMLVKAHEVTLAPIRAENDSSQNDKEAVDEVDGTKSKVGNRASRFQAAVHRAREKLKRESSRSGSSSEDSEDISTSEEEIEDQTRSRLGDISNRGSENGRFRRNKVRKSFSKRTKSRIKEKLTSKNTNKSKSPGTNETLRKSTPPSIMVQAPSTSDISDLGSSVKNLDSLQNNGFSASPSTEEIDSTDGIGYRIKSSDRERSVTGEDVPSSPVQEAVVHAIETSAGIAGGLLWKGKDYVNFIVKDVVRPDIPEDDNVDRRTTPRMPWHDISLMVQGFSARDVGRHFIQRWNAIKTEKAKFHKRYPFLLPKSYKRMGFEPEIPPQIIKNNLPSANVNCQVLRSCSKWSAGIDGFENSIYRAYISAIDSAEHYIYIENQFFITNSGPANSPNPTATATNFSDIANVFSMPNIAAEAGNFLSDTFSMGNTSDIVKNLLGKALVDRITRAHKEKKKFRVYILVPLLPAFEGQVEDSSTGNALRVILHYNYASMCRGPNSLFSRLRDNGINPMDYISFTSLRTCSELCGSPVTELVYIHSKLMIVDDRIVICGSANINDRSLNGSRDSEVCLRIEDVEFDDGCLMNKQKFKSGKFAGSLRRRLMREHLGLLPKVIDEVSASAPDNDKMAQSLSDAIIQQPVNDCTSDEFYRNVWLKTASSNTKLFEDAFSCSPTDSVKTLIQLQEYNNKIPQSEFDRYGAKKVLKGVKGNLVLLPLQFLSDENLLPSYLSKEGWVPAETWT